MERLAAALFVTIVLGAAVAALAGARIDPGSTADTTVFICVIGLYLATGFAVGRWWALGLALLPILLAVPVGDPNDDGVAVWTYTAIDTVGLWGPLMIAGVTARKLTVLGRRRLKLRR
jgi:hypothetical protein